MGWGDCAAAGKFGEDRARARGLGFRRADRWAPKEKLRARADDGPACMPADGLRPILAFADTPFDGISE